MSRLLLNMLLAITIWAIWLGVLGAEQAHSIINQHFEIALTMLFGSFVAGSTSVGGGAVAGVLIRPVSVAEIERTAREGLLMPPKSTFFTPKLRTGLVVRSVE